MKIKYDIQIEIPDFISARGIAERAWITTADFEFTIVFPNGERRTFIIPAGFITDFYSIPRFLHFWRANRPGYGEEASVIHDFLRRFNKDLGLSIAFVDLVFYVAMEYYKLDWNKTKYVAVRMFAWATKHKGIGDPDKRIEKIYKKKNLSLEEYRQKVLEANRN